MMDLFATSSGSILILGLILISLAELHRYLGKYADPSETDESNTPFIPLDTRFVRSFIITHTDFDGLTSGALLLRFLGTEAGLLFSSPRHIDQALHTASRGLGSGDSIFIADLALPPEQETNLTPLLDHLRERGVRLHWYDHHEWPMGLQDRLRQRIHSLAIDPSVRTAAELVRSLLPMTDTHADKLLRFVNRKSLPEDKDWDEIWRLVLSELSQRKDPDLSEKILRSWAADEPIGIMENHLAKEGRQRESLTQEIAGYRHPKMTTRQNRSFLVIDVRAKHIARDENGRLLFAINQPRPSVMVGSLACKTHHADFCIVLWEDFRYSIYRGMDNSVDFKELLPGVTHDGTKYKVSGHGYASSVTLQPSIWSILKSLILWRIPAEAKRFIQLLAERY